MGEGWCDAWGAAASGGGPATGAWANAKPVSNQATGSGWSRVGGRNDCGRGFDGEQPGPVQGRGA
jgi:hypothetical protein